MIYILALYSMVVFSEPIDKGSCDLSSVVCYNESKEYIKEYVKKEFDREGLDGNIALKVIDCESYTKLDESYVNRDGSVDRGLWMLNSKYHPEISDECSYNLECSTKHAIKIVKQWGNFNAWICYRNLLVK